MATAEELLSGSSTSEDKTLIISNDLRTITIPPSVKCLGVENDDDVLELKFKMPRYLGSLDLSTFAIRVNYRNVKGYKDAYTVNNATVGSNYITFSWIVGPTATEYKGNTAFNVCLKTLTSDGNVDKEFNTTIATLPVLEGLEADPIIVSAYSDIIEQWRQELFGIGDTEEASIRSASQEEQENIAQKGIEVLATIPEDYTTTFNIANNADRTKADAIICSSQGEIISVDDSSDDHLRGLRVFGKTTQVTTTGKNLFDVESALSNQKRGTTAVSDYTAYGNGVKVSSNSYDNGRAYMYLNLAAGTYNISANVKVSSSWNFSVKNYDTDTELINNTSSSDGFISYSFTIDADALIGFCFMSTVTSGPTTTATDIQLEFGTEATSYEPYSGGFASPSPDWSQELMSIGNSGIVNIAVCGKNLVSSIIVGEKSDNYANGLLANISILLPDTTYTLSFVGAADHKVYVNENLFTYQYFVCDGTRQSLIVKTKSTVSKEDPGQYTSGCWVILKNSAGNTVQPDFTDVQIELGEISTDYEPYSVQTVTLSAPNGLHGVPVDSGGNYTDSNGQQWVCDEVNFERGVYVQRVNTAVMDGTESITIEERSGGTYRFVIRFANPVKAQYVYNGFCTHMKYGQEPIGMNETDKVMCIWTTGNAYCRYDDITTVDKMIEWLTEQNEAGTPVTIKYILATPIETALTAEEIEAFKALYSNFHNTTVLNDSGATMLLKYNADTKTYLDNLPKATDEQVQAAVDAWLTAHFSSAEGVSF